MKVVNVAAQSASIDKLDLDIVQRDLPDIDKDECLVKVGSAGVNPSDVKAVLGFMSHAVWPRTPGRDYAGTVLKGPAELVGKDVWGSGGELGIRRNGSHGGYIVVPADSVRVKPANLSMEEAGSVGVPFITAFEGLRRAGGVKQGSSILVLGANGKVGQATIQLASRAGVKIFGVERNGCSYIGHANSAVTMIDASTQKIDETVRALTDGRGADIVFNTVGSPYFEQANKSMAKLGAQVFISTIDRAVPFDIFSFYRGQHTYIGVDTLALDSVYGATVLDQLYPDFESGVLKPFPIDPKSVYSLDDAALAYQAVLGGSRSRVLLKP